MKEDEGDLGDFQFPIKEINSSWNQAPLEESEVSGRVRSKHNWVLRESEIEHNGKKER